MTSARTLVVYGNDMDLNALFDAAKADLDKNGFVGMDYNMCVLCIIAKRTGRKLQFAQGRVPATGMELSYEDKLDYWARKRHFGHLQVRDEDDMLAHAAKEYEIAP